VELEHFGSAERFLKRTRAALESNEVANGLMLGLCDRLVEHPERFKAAPCLKVVVDGEDLVLAALMTPPHNLIVYGHQGDLGQAARALAGSLRRGSWKVPGVFGPGEAAATVAEAWALELGRPCSLSGRQRVYELREVLVPVPERGRLRPATGDDLDLVTGWHYAFHHEIFGRTDREQARRAAEVRVQAGDIFLWEDGQPVSVAMKTRPTRNGISIGLVYTPPELRGRGYATACVGELSRKMLGAGRQFCALFADLANPISNHIYERIGFRPVCDYEEYRLEEA
jgi:predicted GNAT family acetyltransferase